MTDPDASTATSIDGRAYGRQAGTWDPELVEVGPGTPAEGVPGGFEAKGPEFEPGRFPKVLVTPAGRVNGAAREGGADGAGRRGRRGRRGLPGGVPLVLVAYRLAP